MGIYSKIAEVMAEVQNVPKTGYNKFHRYPYATETDVLNAIRPLMVKAGLVLIPTVEEVSTSVSAGSVEKGKEGHDITTTKMRFVLADTKTGETMDIPWYGQGQDTQDKGTYKAITGAHKYLLMKLFQVPTGDDPEQDTAQPSQQEIKKTHNGVSDTVRALRQKVLLKEATLSGLAQTYAEIHGLEEGFKPLITDKQREKTRRVAQTSTDAEELTKAVHWLEGQIEKAKLEEVVTT